MAKGIKILLVVLACIFLLLGCNDGSDKELTSALEPPTVRVTGPNLLSPSGQPVFLKIASWENPFDGTVTEHTIVEFLHTMKSLDLNCILLKGNMWLVNDQLGKKQNNIDTMHRLIEAAESLGIYVILNMFDVWSRGKGTNAYNKNPATHPINVWNWEHRFKAADFTKWVTKEFIRHPLVIFELGNEMEHNGAEQFKRVAKEHILPHFYAIAGTSRPIGVSQQQLWSLPVNILFNHRPDDMQRPQGRPIITNELAYDTDLWKDSAIRNPNRAQEYYAAFHRAQQAGHSGVSAATSISHNKPFNAAAQNVLKKLGGL